MAAALSARGLLRRPLLSCIAAAATSESGSLSSYTYSSVAPYDSCSESASTRDISAGPGPSSASLLASLASRHAATGQSPLLTTVELELLRHSSSQHRACSQPALSHLPHGLVHLPLSAGAGGSSPTATEGTAATATTVWKQLQTLRSGIAGTGTGMLAPSLCRHAPRLPWSRIGTSPPATSPASSTAPSTDSVGQGVLRCITTKTWRHLKMKKHKIRKRRRLMRHKK